MRCVAGVRQRGDRRLLAPRSPLPLSRTFVIIALDALLLPMSRIADSGGPTNSMPAALHAREKASFSERKPYPGCTARAPERTATSRIASARRYDSADGAGPMRYASSACV